MPENQQMFEQILRVQNDQTKKLDGLIDGISGVKVEMARFGQELKDRPRPCAEVTTLTKVVDGHVADHKAGVKTWRDSVINNLVRLAFIALVGMFMFWLGNREGSNAKASDKPRAPRTTAHP